MRAVLGIDAAWTPRQPSGVAAVVETASGWRLAAVTGSYTSFEALAYPTEHRRRSGEMSPPDASALLATGATICGRSIDLVAIDMPLARFPITGRRASDDAVSVAYGAKHCGTHSPSRARPGRISDDLREGFEQAGYPLRTADMVTPGLIEVYPHPALVELSGATKRLPYKIGRVRSYWPQLSASERRAQLWTTWREIVFLLDQRIDGVAVQLPELNETVSTAEMKSFEDKLDAIVCAWVAICYLEGKATPYGDKDSSIWIPSPTTICAVR
jgi:predicted RNase H-like nuclease